MASTVIHKVTWPHEVVYTSEEKPASYQDLSIPLFVQGFLIDMEFEEGSVKQLMSTHLHDLKSIILNRGTAPGRIRRRN